MPRLALQVALGVGSGGTNLATNPSFETGSGTVEVRRNLVTNPSFEVNTSGWTAAGSSTISRDTAEFYVGAASGRVVATAAQGRIASAAAIGGLSAGVTYSVSAWVKGESGKEISVGMLDANGGVGIGSTVYAAPVVATGAWQRVLLTRTTQALTNGAFVVVRNETAGAHTFYVDAVLLQASPVLGDYFDGATSAGGDFTYAWTGTANASASVQNAVGVVGIVGGGNRVVYQSQEWASSGTRSMRVTPTSTATGTTQWGAAVARNSSGLMAQITGGLTYTAIAKFRQTAPQTGTIDNSRARRMYLGEVGNPTALASGPQADNVAGESVLTWTFTAPTGISAGDLLLYLGGGTTAGNGDVWWDDFALVEGTYTGGYFTGTIPPGNLVDVSQYARLTDGISYRWGRTDQFYGAEPGVFDFVLDNADGRFTPDNPSSPLATKLTEGAAVCVSVGGRLTAGTVRSIEPEFPSAEAAWALVRVSCDDLLGRLARTRLLSLADQLSDAAGLYGLWKFDDEVDSSSAVDSGPLGLPPFVQTAPGDTLPVFGAESLPWVGDDQALMGTVLRTGSFSVDLSGYSFDYDANSSGWVGFWLTTDSTAAVDEDYLTVTVELGNGIVTGVRALRASLFPSGSTNALNVVSTGGGSTLATDLATPVYVTFNVRVNGVNIDVDLYVDGSVVQRSGFTAHGGATTPADLAVRRIIITPGSPTSTSSYRVSRVTHTRDRARDYLARDTNTLKGIVNYLVEATEGVTYSVPAELSNPGTFIDNVEGDSALDLLNDVLKAEQGYVRAVTSGTLLAPTEQLVLRERRRPTTVTTSFSVRDELADAPAFVRDIRNLISTLRVDTPETRLIVQDNNLRARAGNASDAERLVTTDLIYSRAWGQDRIVRGSGSQMQIQSVVVDAMTTPTNRAADILALVPGDRVQFTGLPSTQLGFTTFDGWFLGAEERHTIDEHAFELYFAPIIPNLGKYGTARYAADGVLSLSAGINSSVTSMSVATTGPRFTQTELPTTVIVDSEEMTVTAVSGATPQVFTVTRGVNGTTAAAHSSAALVEIKPTYVYGF